MTRSKEGTGMISGSSRGSRTESRQTGVSRPVALHASGANANSAQFALLGIGLGNTVRAVRLIAAARSFCLRGVGGLPLPPPAACIGGSDRCFR